MDDNKEKAKMDFSLEDFEKMFNDVFPDLPIDLQNTLEDYLDDMELDDEEREMLTVALKDNHLEVPDGNERYGKYNAANRGCSMKNPFVLSELDGYVHLEYLVMQYLTRHNPNRIASFEMNHQELRQNDGHWYDLLRFKVKDYRGTVSTEEYWFDITKGYEHTYQSIKAEHGSKEDDSLENE